MASSKSKSVADCFKSNNISTTEQRSVSARANAYNTGSPEADIRLAVQDILAELYDTRIALKAALNPGLTPEETWDALAPDNAFPYDSQSDALKAAWVEAMATDSLDQAKADELIEDLGSVREALEPVVGLTPDTVPLEEVDFPDTSTGMVRDAARNLLYAVTDVEINEGLTTLVDMVIQGGQDTTLKPAVDFAYAALTGDFTFDGYPDTYRLKDSIREAAVKLLAERVPNRKMAMRGDTEAKWFTFLKNNNGTQYLDPTKSFPGIPDEFRPRKNTEAAAPSASRGTGSDPSPKAKDATLFIRMFRYRVESITDKRRKELEDLYAEADPDIKSMLVSGIPISEFFTPDGELKTNKIGGKTRMTTVVRDEAEIARIEADIKDEIEEQRKANDAETAQKLVEFRRQSSLAKAASPNFGKEGDGNFKRSDGTPAKPLEIGRVRLLVKNFIAKLAVKPNVFVYRNLADLKANNPNLYKRAADSRLEGDFDTTEAMGYSFGPNVIIFSDFIRSEQQLKFVVAHETLGHFGFKGLVGKAEMEKLFNRLYENDGDVRAGADRNMDMGMGKMEAIEEYLADYAAMLDDSLLLRVWNMLKSALNKLGLKFGDEEARYFVAQARRYVRDGGGVPMTHAAIAARMAWVSEGFDGRFAVDNGSTVHSMFGAVSASRGVGRGGWAGIMDSLESNGMTAPDRVREGYSKVVRAISTLANQARQNVALGMIYDFMSAQVRKANEFMSNYNNMTEFTHKTTMFGFGKGAPSDEDKQLASDLLAWAALFRGSNITDAKLKKFDKLVKKDADGSVSIDADVLKELQQAGFVTADEFRAGFEIDYGEGGKMSLPENLRNIDENSNAWRIYKEMRNASNQAQVDLLLANFGAYEQEVGQLFSRLNRKRKAEQVLNDEDLRVMRMVSDMYRRLRYKESKVDGAKLVLSEESRKEAEAFVIAFGRAMFDDNALKDFVEGKGTAKQFADDDFKAIREATTAVASKFSSNPKQSFAAQKAIRDAFQFDFDNRNAELYAKKSILGSYAPLARRGDYQVRVVAYGPNGRPLMLSDGFRGTLPLFQFESMQDAIEAQNSLTESFGDKTMTMTDADGNQVEVRLVAERTKTRQDAGTNQMDFGEFVYTLNNLGIELDPKQREAIVVALTNQENKARSRLNRTGTPGWDPDVIRSIDEHLETLAHVSAKKLFQHRIADVFTQDDLWNGSMAKLQDLKTAMENATGPDKDRARKEYELYRYQFYHSAPNSSENFIIDANGKKKATLAGAEDARRQGQEILEWYSSQTDLASTTEGLLSTKFGSDLKMITVLMHLGGQVASAALNLLSILTHAIPYIAFYNEKRGFGGGYGLGNAMRELQRAMFDIKSPMFDDTNALQKMVDKGEWGKYRLTEQEARDILKLSREGVLQAAQFNALAGNSRGRVFNNKAQGFIKVWMSAFSYTEQMNRRATALSVYRLEYNRSIAQGLTPDAAREDAMEAARRAVDYAQGEYGSFNRPKMARGHIAQYIFMYKQFPIITIELLRNMPPAGRTWMLVSLFILAGMKGLPFAEDLMDIIDTLMQKLGMKTASIEAEMTRNLEAIVPGLSSVVMRGVMDTFLGTTISSRSGMGDMAPLTGSMRAGADASRELLNFAGPVVGAIGGLLGTAGSLATYGAEVLGIKDDKTSLLDILRDSPLAAVRALADSYVYATTGSIYNTRGQIIAPDVGWGTTVWRMLGFYPIEATRQNDIVRLSDYTRDYALEVKTSYRLAAVKAKVAGDDEALQNIYDDVDAWNKEAEGTGLEMRNFRQGVNRAYKEAQRSAVDRFMKAAPKDVKPVTEELNRALGGDLFTQQP